MPTEQMGDTAKLVGAMMRLHHNTKFRVCTTCLPVVTVARTQSTAYFVGLAQDTVPLHGKPIGENDCEIDYFCHHQ